jgi:RimJ/RimL family protein N-acetyltransferase
MGAYKLREWRMSDVESLAGNANNIKIWNNVRDYFPHPYTVKDGEEFIAMVLNKSKPITDFAIEVERKTVGGIGIVLNSDVERITAEIGLFAHKLAEWFDKKIKQ